LPLAQGVKLGRPKIGSATERKVRKQLGKGMGYLEGGQVARDRDWHGAAHRKGALLKGSIAILCYRRRHCPLMQLRGKADPLCRGEERKSNFTPAMPPRMAGKKWFLGVALFEEVRVEKVFAVIFLIFDFREARR
jgi:hypothetical protein